MATAATTDSRVHPFGQGDTRKLGVSNKAAFNDILYMLQTSIPWEDLPKFWAMAAV